MINSSQIKSGMDVRGSDGQHVGRVDHMDGDNLKLSRSSKEAMDSWHDSNDGK